MKWQCTGSFRRTCDLPDKKLLKELGIKDTDKEVKARVVVWYQSEQSDLLFSQTWQVKLIGGGKPCKALQI